MLGLRFCSRAFSSCGERGPLFIAVRGPLTVAASLVAEHRLQTRRLSNCGSRAHLLRGMWDLPRPGLGPVPCISRQILNHCATREAPKGSHFDQIKIKLLNRVWRLIVQRTWVSKLAIWVEKKISSQLSPYTILVRSSWMKVLNAEMSLISVWKDLSLKAGEVIEMKKWND